MGIDARISCGTGEIFMLLVGDMQVSSWISVLFRESKVDDLHQNLIYLSQKVNTLFNKKNYLNQRHKLP